MVTTQELLFEWDVWKAQARASGVAEDLAELGRKIMRDAYMQRWPEEVLGDCGWNDDGFGMLALARGKPAEARRDWERLYARYHRRPVCSIDPTTQQRARALVKASAPNLARGGRERGDARP